MSSCIFVFPNWALTAVPCVGYAPRSAPTVEARASQVALVVKNTPANGGDPRDRGSIPGSGRPHGVGHSSVSYLENSADRGAWWATVHGVTMNQT